MHWDVTVEIPFSILARCARPHFYCVFPREVKVPLLTVGLCDFYLKHSVSLSVVGLPPLSLCCYHYINSKTLLQVFSM